MTESNDPATEIVAGGERDVRARVRAGFGDWSRLVLAGQGLSPAAHHLRLIEELERLEAGEHDRLMLLLPPGSAKSTYAVLNVLIGTLGAMATSVVGYWVGSSAGADRKDEHLVTLAQRSP